MKDLRTMLWHRANRIRNSCGIGGQRDVASLLFDLISFFHVNSCVHVAKTIELAQLICTHLTDEKSKLKKNERRYAISMTSPRHKKREKKNGSIKPNEKPSKLFSPMIHTLWIDLVGYAFMLTKECNKLSTERSWTNIHVSFWTTAIIWSLIFSNCDEFTFVCQKPIFVYRSRNPMTCRFLLNISLI